MAYEEIILQDAHYSGDYLGADISPTGGVAIAVNEGNRPNAIVILSPEDSRKLATFITENVKQPEEEQIGLLEALSELKAGRKVKVFHFGAENFIEPEHGLDDVWYATNLNCLEDLLETSFYKVNS